MKNPNAVALGQLGGNARNKALTAARRSAIAKYAVSVREKRRRAKKRKVALLRPKK